MSRTVIPPAAFYPKVTLIISAYNEEDIIREKISNTQQLDYPADLLEIIFITDGSTDKTPEIISQFPEFRLLHQNERKGKLAAMNRAISHTTSGITIFSDANGFLNRNCIRRLVQHYSDPRVGGVTGEKKIEKTTGSVADGEGLYWKYESLLKQLDSDLNSVVGAAGELFSLRTELYTPIPANIIIEDFVQSLLLCRRGFKVKYEAGAYSTEKASLHIRDEMERKIRISAGAFQAMWFLKDLLNIFRHPLLSFQYISHRVLRWTLCPLALIFFLVSTCALYLLTNHQAYALLAVFQLLCYAAAAIGWQFALKNQKLPVFYLPFYFAFMNFCVLAGFRRFIGGEQLAVWKKADRR